MSLHRISSLDIPQIQPYRTLRRPLEHLHQGIFVAEGEKVVRRLLASGIPLVSILATRLWHARLKETVHSTKLDEAEIYIADEALMREIVGFNFHQGIMAVGKIPPEPSPDELTNYKLVVALDGLRNAENVGVIIRNCAAFGVDGVIVGRSSCSPYLRRAVRNSMGTIFSLPAFHVANLADTLAKLRNTSGLRIIGAALDGNPITTADFSGKLCIIFGNEDSGISPELLAVCDERVTIPMRNNTDSLNVASASAVVLYAATARDADCQ